ncbi:PREDICTED: uncharacterized protein LOC105511919 [Colobus angolensis palliatus]|uniref:uncharacterized protein LOC105511919 n=1 Tax=Colobus angolensis palliatus TaxID=336983 RepID=UPI0005F374E3|nr:PREDICTED: uncharacterized protein LOC105511919 [Colobus angolensis palliatus]
MTGMHVSWLQSEPLNPESGVAAAGKQEPGFIISRRGRGASSSSNSVITHGKRKSNGSSKRIPPSKKHQLGRGPLPNSFLLASTPPLIRFLQSGLDITLHPPVS